jgi:hypothetical protein
MKTYKPGQIITLKGGIKLRIIANSTNLCRIYKTGEKCYFFRSVCVTQRGLPNCRNIIFRRIK